MEKTLLKVRVWVLAAEVGTALLFLLLLAVFAMLGYGMATWRGEP